MQDALFMLSFARIKISRTNSFPVWRKSKYEHYNTVKFLYFSKKNLLINQLIMNIWMTNVKQLYTAHIRVSGLKLWSLRRPLSKIAQLQWPRAYSFKPEPLFAVSEGVLSPKCTLMSLPDLENLTFSIPTFRTVNIPTHQYSILEWKAPNFA